MSAGWDKKTFLGSVGEPGEVRVYLEVPQGRASTALNALGITSIQGFFRTAAVDHYAGGAFIADFKPENMADAQALADKCRANAALFSAIEGPVLT
jgi:hypothetical protein